MQTEQRSPGRLLAPIALVAFGLALLLIVASGGGGGDGGSSASSSKQEQKDLGVTRGEKRQKKAKSRDTKLSSDVYVVKAGDTLGSIAERTGVTVEQLQDLNPELDPQALVSGQKIKLRE
jgi:teichoic acid transport system ATP-binding protein